MRYGFVIPTGDPRTVAELAHELEEHGWDGAWYRRAYFDDGRPLGSATNGECQIDSLPQSWSVLSAAGEPGRARAAMAAVDHDRQLHRTRSAVAVHRVERGPDRASGEEHVIDEHDDRAVDIFGDVRRRLGQHRP